VWDTKLDYVLVELLDFCGCGRPEDAAEYIRDGLRLIAERFEKPEKEFDFPAYSGNLTAHFGSMGARYFFWYWCYDKGLTEHGGSVPGWLTPKGNALLAFLNEVSDGV